MARGQKQKADKQLGITNKIGKQENTQQQALESKLIPGYSSLMDTGYLSPEEEGAATTSEMGAATQPFESAGFQASNRAAATRNASDETAAQTQLALDKGRTAGEAAATLQNQKMQNQEAGMYGLGNLKAQDQQTMAQMYGLGPGTLQGRAAGQSEFGQIMGAVGGVGQAAATAFGG